MRKENIKMNTVESIKAEFRIVVLYYKKGRDKKEAGKGYMLSVIERIRSLNMLYNRAYKMNCL